MENESTTVTHNAESPKKRTSFIAYLAILLAIGALLFASHNFYMTLRTNMRLDQTINRLKQSINTAPKQTASSSTTPDAAIAKAFSRIAAISAQVQTLSSLPSKPPVSLNKTIDAVQSTDTHLPWYQRFFESFKAVKTLFVIRHVEQPASPIINADQATLAKENILLQLSMAQWALLNNQKIVYQSALQAATQWLTTYFSLSDATQPIIDSINELMKTDISSSLPQLPEIASPQQPANAQPTKPTQHKNNTSTDVET